MPQTKTIIDRIKEAASANLIGMDLLPWNEYYDTQFPGYSIDTLIEHCRAMWASLMGCLYGSYAKNPQKQILEVFHDELLLDVFHRVYGRDGESIIKKNLKGMLLYLYNSILADDEPSIAINGIVNAVMPFKKGEQVLCYNMRSPHLIFSLLDKGCNPVVYEDNPRLTAQLHIVLESLGLKRKVVFAYTPEELGGLPLHDKGVCHFTSTDNDDARIFRDLLVKDVVDDGEMLLWTDARNGMNIGNEWQQCREAVLKRKWLKVAFRLVNRNYKSREPLYDFWHLDKKGGHTALYYDTTEGFCKDILPLQDFDYDKLNVELSDLNSQYRYVIDDPLHSRFAPPLLEYASRNAQGKRVVAMRDIVKSTQLIPEEFKKDKLLSPRLCRIADDCSDATDMKDVFPDKDGLVYRIPKPCVGILVGNSGNDIEVCQATPKKKTPLYVPHGGIMFEIKNSRICNKKWLLWYFTDETFRDSLVNALVYSTDGNGFKLLPQYFFDIGIVLPTIEEQEHAMDLEHQRQIEMLVASLGYNIPQSWNLADVIDEMKEKLSDTHTPKDVNINIEKADPFVPQGVHGKYLIMVKDTGGKWQSVDFTGSDHAVLYLFYLIHVGKSFTNKALKNNIDSLFIAYNLLYSTDKIEADDDKIVSCLTNIVKSEERRDRAKSCANKSVSNATGKRIGEQPFNIVKRKVDGEYEFSIDCKAPKICKEFKEELNYWKNWVSKHKDWVAENITNRLL